MSDSVNFAEIVSQRVELLPARTLLQAGGGAIIGGVIGDPGGGGSAGLPRNFFECIGKGLDSYLNCRGDGGSSGGCAGAGVATAVGCLAGGSNLSSSEVVWTVPDSVDIRQ